MSLIDQTELRATVAPCLTRRAAVALGAAALLGMPLVGCGHVAAEPGEAPNDSDVETGELPVEPEPEPKKIACWGDSLTEGYGAGEAYIETSWGTFDASYLSYPEILEQLSGLRTFNRGVSGATSDEIVAMMLDVEPPEGIEMEHFSRRVAKRAHKHPGDILVVEMGSNGGWDGDFNTLIEQYYTMISASGCEDYLIIGDTDDPGTSIADTAQEPFDYGQGPGKTEWERVLRAEFGDRFINMRRYLILYGLKVCGFEPTEEDEDLARRGCVSPQLRYDWTHLNSYGYYVQARAIYRRGLKLGLWA